jgi:NAD+ kinase
MLTTPETRFQRIAIIGKLDEPRIDGLLTTLIEHLNHHGRKVSISSDLAHAGANPVAEEQLSVSADLMIAIGGDGTILRAARLVAAARVPLLGINLGRLGFLADVSPDEVRERIDDVLSGRYVEESRAMLEAHVVHPGGSAPVVGIALNDVAVQKWESGRMFDFETWIDGQYVNTHRGDGMVVATATGSTAYALSSGGPILHPQLDALALVPICPHTLSDRPIVVRSSSTVEIRLIERHDTRAVIVCDGVALGDLLADGKLFIRPHSARVTLLHPPEHDYYRILRSKLRWGRGGDPEPRDE